ncbi:MAG: IclR family transcriptional regulator [Methylobacteriaceae bacterium]|jgi:DNA-binding IclR family transcriptional regulator|nr:IclR family transcriptional regulator [Methylobacteriaceae bacterium]
MTAPYRVPAVLRTLNILEYLAARGDVSLSELVADMAWPRSSTFHILNTFVEAGYVRNDGGRYRLSGKIHEVSNMLISRFDLRPIALPFLRRLNTETGLGVNLGIISKGEAVYAVKIGSDKNALSTAWVGKPLSLMGSSLGKCLMAWREKDEILELLARNPLSQVAPRTITDVESYLVELEHVRREGIAEDIEESVPGVRCFGAPVFNGQKEVIGAVSCSASVEVFNDQNIPFFKEKLLETVRAIEENL